jgi:RNA polymerase sigma-70 factor (TIGR02960 family)
VTAAGPRQDAAADPGSAAITTEAEFARLAGQHRRELHLHCYRMLASFDEAEDAVQETLLRAWRARESFDGGLMARAWLYRIATNVCLDLLRRRARRLTAVHSLAEVPWLQPYPDTLLDEIAPAAERPDEVVVERETVELAFIAALQVLPARQRAALISRDVLGWSANQTADLLSTSVAAANSALQRARETMARRLPGPDRERAPLPRSARERDIAARFAAAFSGDDIDGVVALLTEDACFTMPPVTLEFQGPAAIGGFLRDIRGWRGPRRYRLVPVRANGQPAFGCYLQEGPDAGFGAHGLIVLTLEGDRISALTRFTDNGNLGRFGLPLELT